MKVPQQEYVEKPGEIRGDGDNNKKVNNINNHADEIAKNNTTSALRQSQEIQEKLSVNSRKMQLLEKRLATKDLKDSRDSSRDGLINSREIPKATQSESKDDSQTMIQTVSNGNSNSNSNSMDGSSRKRKRFTSNEDERLIEGYRRYVNDWPSISTWFGTARTTDQLRRRFTRIKTKQPRLLEHMSLQPPTKIRRIEEPKKKKKKTKKTTKKKAKSASPSSMPPPTAFVESNKPELTANTSKLSAVMESTQELQRLREREQRVVEREADVAKREEALKERLKEMEQNQIDFRSKMCDVLLRELRIKARQERAERRRILAQRIVTLGHQVYTGSSQNMMSYKDVWVDGTLLKELQQKLGDIAQRKLSIEQERKNLKKKKAEEDLPYPPETAKRYIIQRLEVLSVLLKNFRTEENELRMRIEAAQCNKKLHIRELKRCNDEDNSKWNDYRLLNDRFLLLNLLGKGGFSEVYQAFDMRELRYVACKVHQISDAWSGQKKRSYTKHSVREYRIHESLNHPCVVRQYDVFQIEENSFCTVLEFCEDGDLDVYLKKHTYLREREARAIIKQIFSGLLYLSTQKRQIIHYDLKPGNILFLNGQVKITDFGLSKVMDEDVTAMELTSQGAGTYWYLPPECFETKNKPKISSKVDVWSVGVIFYQLLYGKKPFGDECSQQRYRSFTF
eukprot:TRINITY_DN1474_c0_g1_i4.p1 TRINITY_DN1474_c0_g1~~TRINITY_DN1474_c0_g1_i4.p1  ORF type:complete len:678 (+),score=129.02 TRINITY_DN1474_c0_g1_i4:147-2180(+)